MTKSYTTSASPNQKPDVPAWGWVWYPLAFFMFFFVFNSVMSLVKSDGFVLPSQLTEYNATYKAGELKFYEPTTVTSPNVNTSRNNSLGQSVSDPTSSRIVGQGAWRLELKLEGKPTIANTKYIPNKENSWQEFINEVQPGETIRLKLFKSSLENAKTDGSIELTIYGLGSEKKSYISYNMIDIFFEFWMWNIFMIGLLIVTGTFMIKWTLKARKWSANKKAGLYAAEFAAAKNNAPKN